MKKLIVLCMCVTMIGSTGIAANAASGTFNFYVDSVGGNNYSSKVSKSGSTNYANISMTTCKFNGSSGLYLRVRKDFVQATGNYSITGTGTYKPTYYSDYAKAGTGYDIYAYTLTSCGYGAQLGGSWTP